MNDRTRTNKQVSKLKNAAIFAAGSRPSEDKQESWAEARSKIATRSITLRIDVNWSSFQLAN
jgi:hypothetical protein